MLTYFDPNEVVADRNNSAVHPNDCWCDKCVSVENS